MSIFKAFFGLGKIPKVTKFFEFKSFDDVNQMGGAIANIKQQVKEGGLQLTNAQQKFLDDQMKQVEMVFELISKSPQSGIRNTESAKVFNLSGQRLDPNQPIIGGTQPGKKIDQDTFRRLAETNTQRIKQRISDKKVETDAEILARIKKENKEAAEKLREKRIKEKMDDMKEIEDPEDMATGGRVGLKDGMNRRTFLKIMGGLASIPILGKFFKGAKVATGTKVASDVASTVSKSTPPPYFFELANKIKSLGKPDKVTYADRVEIHRYTGKNGDEYELVEDLSTGDMKITKDKLGTAGSGEETYEGVMDRSVLEYKKGDVNVDPDKKIASKAPDEYEEYKVEFDVDGTEAGADAIDEVVQKEIIEEVNQQAPKIKKAGGGVAYMLGE